jgi:prepilin-type N-terminal cleavage/methylation domain-containing protein
MNVRISSHPAVPARGFTLVEILLVVSLLVILLAFALPSSGSATARAEMQAAVENLEYSVDTARNVARLAESGITLEIETPSGAAAQRIHFSRSAVRPRKGGPEIPEYLLPEGIRAVSTQDRFEFDARGLVEQPGRIVLVSRVDDSITSTIEIN